MIMNYKEKFQDIIDNINNQVLILDDEEYTLSAKIGYRDITIETFDRKESEIIDLTEILEDFSILNYSNTQQLIGDLNSALDHYFKSNECDG